MLALPKNARFKFRGLTGVIEDVKARYVMLDFEDRGLEKFEPHQLEDAYVQGEFEILSPKVVTVVDTITDPAVSDKYRFITYCMVQLHQSGLPKSERVAKKVAAEAVKKFGMLDGSTPSASTLKRWYKKWFNNDKSVSYILRKSKETRRSQFTAECKALADNSIDENYLKFHGCSVSEAYCLFLQEYKKQQSKWERERVIDNNNTGETLPPFKPMSRTAFYDYVSKLDAYEVDKARLGMKAARKKHRCVTGSIITNRPLERVEVDAVHLNICVKVEMKDGTFTYERPILYVAMDVHTRLVVGFVIEYSLGKPGETADAVMQLLKQICNPFKVSKHLKRPFPLGGKPESIVSDSGTAFIATSIRMAMQSQFIEHHVTQKASPWKKPFVERYFRTLKGQCMSKLPGYVGPRIRGSELDKTLPQLAQLSKDEFETNIEHYILNIYHHNPHKGLDNWSPIDSWQENEGSFPPVALCDFVDLSKHHAKSVQRKISSPSGITVNNIKYNCMEIQSLFHKLTRQLGNKPEARTVTVMFSDMDVSKVTVIHDLIDRGIVTPSISKGVVSGMSRNEFIRMKDSKKPASIERQSMARIADKKQPPKQSKNQRSEEAIDITQPYSVDLLDDSLGHSENHMVKVLTQGTQHEASDQTPDEITPSKVR
jgi:putative transposase